MKITDIKCAVIASSPVIRITTDEGITGWAQIETPKPYLQPIVLQLKSWLVGQDPVHVERVVKRIRVRGGFKPWGSAVSAVPRSTREGRFRQSAHTRDANREQRS